MTYRQASVRTICFSNSGLAHVLFQVYLKRIQGEDLSQAFSDTNLRDRSFPLYHRASYASLLRLIKNRVTVDWDKTIGNLLSLIESDHSLFMGRNYIQELYMHVLDVYSVDILRKVYNIGTDAASIGDLRTWTGAPPAVCVTMKVSRAALAVFISCTCYARM